MHSKVWRKEGRYHLYRCRICLHAKYGEDPTPAQVKSASFSNVRRHHEAAHPGLPYERERGDVYVQLATQEGKLLKQYAPLMHLCDYYPPPPFYVEPNPEPI